jgi:RNA polymerase primary sigma factor
LYDSLLDELEDDVVSNPQEVEELTEKAVDAEEAEAELLGDDGEVTAIAQRDSEQDGDSSNDTASDTEEVLAEQVENWSDDPVRMYLTQMGEIPLLTRAQEIFPLIAPCRSR